MDSLRVVDLVLGGLALYFVKILVLPKKTPAPLPPGPKPKPFVGNLHDLPPPGEYEWVHWTKHKDTYGPISSITVFGQTIVVLNDQRMVFDLFDKRSTVHSSRPRLVFANEIIGWGLGLANLPYSDLFRAYRKNIHSFLGTKKAVTKFYPEQDIEVRRFLLRVFEEPEKLVHHIRTQAGAIILKISHGYTIEPRGSDPLVDLADKAMTQFSLAVIPGAWLVDVLPFLRHLPDWFPGTGFKRTAVEWKKTLNEFSGKPYAFVKQQVAAGDAVPSFTSALLEKGDLTPEQESIVKWAATSLYAGGADTTVSSLTCFYLAMMIYPEVQRKAQEEIDRVVGTDRLPTFADRENLPYVDAIVKEVLRWHPVGPMGLPHVSSEDDIYEGYFIPKGSIIMPNIWWFTHDPKTYHDPMSFNPSRFLPINGRTPEFDPHALAFGFGRRICPGRELADTSLYLTIAQSLAVFDVRAPANGPEPKVAFIPGAISHPVEYKASITPRNEKAAALIRSIEDEHPFTPSDATALDSVSF